MPTYEYRCDKCGEHHEVVQSFRDDPLTECPACGGPLKKVFGSIGVVFKGSGFYKTDSRSASKSSKDGERSTGKEDKVKETKESAKASSDSSSSSTSSDASDSSTSTKKDSKSSGTPSKAAAAS